MEGMVREVGLACDWKEGEEKMVWGIGKGGESIGVGYNISFIDSRDEEVVVPSTLLIDYQVENVKVNVAHVSSMEVVASVGLVGVRNSLSEIPDLNLSLVRVSFNNLERNLNVTPCFRCEIDHLGRRLKCHTACSKVGDTVVSGLGTIGGHKLTEDVWMNLPNDGE
ncbi:hypothetical protein Tco_1383664 [Tanacetum coccineum]